MNRPTGACFHGVQIRGGRDGEERNKVIADGGEY